MAIDVTENVIIRCYRTELPGCIHPGACCQAGKCLSSPAKAQSEVERLIDPDFVMSEEVLELHQEYREIRGVCKLISEVALQQVERLDRYMTALPSEAQIRADERAKTLEECAEWLDEYDDGASLGKYIRALGPREQDKPT